MAATTGPSPIVQGPAIIQEPSNREVATPVRDLEGQDFSATLGKALRGVDRDLRQADGATADYLAGRTGIHEMALSLEKADLSLRLLLRVRNRILEAYREVTRMGV